MCRQVADTIRHRYHNQIVLRNVVAPLVEHKTALARRTQQVHASVAQFLGIHAVEVGGILKIYLHIVAVYSAKLHIIYYINERMQQNMKILTHFVQQ